MITRKRIIINTVNFQKKRNHRLLYDILASLPYSDESGYGFNNILNEDNSFSGTLVRRNATFINVFSSEKADFEKQQIFVFTEISFIVYFDLGIICVFGSITSMNFLKSVLKEAVDDIEIFSTDFTAFGLYEMLKKKKAKIKLEEISINGFNYEDGAVGKFSGKILKPNIGLRLIKQYSAEISKITLRLFTEQEDFVVYMANNGALAIACDEDYFNENLLYLSNLIFTNHG